MVNNNLQVIFTKIPPSESYPEPNEYLQIKESPVDLDAPLKDGEFIVKNLVLSISSFVHKSMHAASGEGPFRDYAAKLGHPVTGANSIGLVIKSTSGARFLEGDIVHGAASVMLEEYSLVGKGHDKRYELRNEIKETKFPPSYYLGILGDIGFTAYAGLVKYGQPKPGETLYVSAAAGNVGILVGQIGKTLGLRVIGSAGSQEKMEFLRSIGYDEVFNYKTDDVSAKLKELAPEGLDIYFDNVGGRAIEVAIDHMKFRGRIVACGAESQYYVENHDGVHNLHKIFLKALKIEGFIVFAEPPEDHHVFRARMAKWIQEGAIKPIETVIEGIKGIPIGMTKIFSGEITGKIVVKVAEH